MSIAINILVFGGCLIILWIALALLYAPLIEETHRLEKQADELKQRNEEIRERGVADRRAIADAYIAASEARIAAEREYRGYRAERRKIIGMDREGRIIYEETTEHGTDTQRQGA